MFKKAISMLLATSMLVGLTACSNGESASKESSSASKESSTATEEKEEVKEDVKVAEEIEVLLTSWSTVLKETDNFLTKAMKEATGVNVKLTTFSAMADTTTNLNLRLVGGTAPDMFALSSPQIQELSQQGYLLDLGPYLDQMPNATALMDEVKTLGQVDGVQYAMVKTPSICQYGYWIRKDWLDKLGLPMPTTTDELYKTVETVMASDPDGNGADDTIGITGEGWKALDPILASYGVAEPTTLTLVDGQVEAPIYNPMYKEALVKINELLDKKVIDNEIMAVSYQLFIDKLTHGTPVVAYTQWTTFNKPDVVDPILEVNPDADWVQIGDLKGEGATATCVFDETLAGGYYGLSSTLEDDPEKLAAVCKVLDYVSTEEGMNLVCYGLEGEHYNVEDGKIVPTELMATGAEFTWLYQFMGRNEREYLGVKFDYATDDIDFAASRKYIQSVTSLVKNPDWYQKSDAERYLQEESMEFMFGLRDFSEFDSFVADLDKTYKYNEFLEYVREDFKNSGITK